MAGINRFMTPAKLPQIGGFFQLPFEQMAQTIDVAQKQQDAVKAGLYNFANTDFKYLQTPNEIQNANQVFSSLDERLQQTLAKQKNGDLRGLTGDVLSLQSDLSKRLRQGGDIYAMETNYNAFTDWYGKQATKEGLAPGYLDQAAKSYLDRFDQQGGSLNNAQLGVQELYEIPEWDKISNELTNDMEKLTREKYGDEILGNGRIKSWSDLKTYLPAEEVETMLIQALESNPKVQGWLNQAGQIGYIPEESVPLYSGVGQYKNILSGQDTPFLVANELNPAYNAIKAMGRKREDYDTKSGFGYKKDDLWYYNREQEQKMKEALILPTAQALSGKSLKGQFAEALANGDMNLVGQLTTNKLIQTVTAINNRLSKDPKVAAKLKAEVAKYNVDNEDNINLSPDGQISEVDFRKLLMNGLPKGTIVDKNNKPIDKEHLLDAMLMSYGERVKVGSGFQSTADYNENLARTYLEKQGYKFRTGLGNAWNGIFGKSNELQLSNREGVLGGDWLENWNFGSSELLELAPRAQVKKINQKTPEGVITEGVGYLMPGDNTYDQWEKAANSGTIQISSSGSKEVGVDQTLASYGAKMKNTLWSTDENGRLFMEGDLYKLEKGKEVAVMSGKQQAKGRFYFDEALSPERSKLLGDYYSTYMDKMESGATQTVVNNVQAGTMFGGSSPAGGAALQGISNANNASDNKKIYEQNNQALPTELKVPKLSQELSIGYSSFITSSLNKVGTTRSIYKVVNIDDSQTVIKFDITKTSATDGKITATLEDGSPFIIKNINTGAAAIQTELPNVLGAALRIIATK